MAGRGSRRSSAEPGDATVRAKDATEDDAPVMEDDGQQCSALMQQIRDLGENWEISVAGLLEEYLEDLEKIVISFEHGDLNLNFTEAALLIQGSTAAYSRKVEYLYKLVFGVLDLLCDSNKMQDVDDARPGARRKKKGIQQACEEAREQFLLLDDVIDVGKNINLDGSEHHETLEDTQGLNERVPVSFLSQRSAVRDPNSAFKMMSCDVDSFGAFVIERSEARKGDRRLTARDIEEATHRAALESQWHDADTKEAGEAVPIEFELEHGDNAAPIEDDYESVDAAPFQLGGDDDHDEQDAYDHGPDEDQSDSEGTAHNAWQRLDPHEPGAAQDEVPLRVARTWAIPKNLQKKAAGQEDTAPRQVAATTNLLVSLALQPALGKRVPSRTSVAFYPEFRPFAVERRKRAREKRKAHEMAKERTARLQHRAADGGDDDDDDDEGADDEEDHLAEAVLHGAPETDDEDEDAGDFGMYNAGGFGGEDDEFGEEVVADGGELGTGGRKLDLDSAAFEASPHSYVDMVKSHLQEYLESANRWASETKLHARVRVWEEKIEPLLHEQNSRPTFDIHAYGGKILSGLALRPSSEQDESAASDDAGSMPFEELGARFGSLRVKPVEQQQGEGDGESDFEEGEEDVSRDPAPIDQYEVCRMFLASLQLANNGNVELVHETNNSELRVRLLDTVLANEKLEGYLAPSAQQQQQSGDTGTKDSRKSKRARHSREPTEQENVPA